MSRIDPTIIPFANAVSLPNHIVRHRKPVPPKKDLVKVREVFTWAITQIVIAVGCMSSYVWLYMDF